MKFILPTRLLPLNIFQILGNSCCEKMHAEFLSQNFSKQLFCYDAGYIYDANVLVIWGSTSQKLSKSIQEYLAYMPKNRYILHIQGCGSSHSHSPEPLLPINEIFSHCTLAKFDYVNLANEAKKCLKG